MRASDRGGIDIRRYRADGTLIPTKHLCALCRLRWKQNSSSLCCTCAATREAVERQRRSIRRFAPKHASDVRYSVYVPARGSVARQFLGRVIPPVGV